MIFGPAIYKRRGTTALRAARSVMLSAVMLLTMGVILARLVELTLLRGSEFRQRADQNRIIIRPVSAQRGVIFDRTGQALTRNVPVTRLVDLPGDEFGPVEVEDIGRFYPFGQFFPHVIGYVGEISQDEIEVLKNTHCTSQAQNECPYQPSAIVGKTGLEKEYDEILRGVDGEQLIEVDARGKLLGIVGEKAPIAGKDLETSLDLKLQQASVETLWDRKGAVIALDPASGKILALASSPGFDPNIFGSSSASSDRDDRAQNDITALLRDTERLALFNRAISGEYPPGSIFKLVTAMAGLEEGKVSSSTTIEDTGEIRVGAFRYGNWYFDQYGRTEGVLGIVRAITRSNDIFFYRVGEWVGPEKLAWWANQLGLGRPSGIDLPTESSGLIPDPDWKQRHIGERWFLGNTYHMAIGQGDIQVTPLQVAMLTAAVITGNKCTPHIANSEFRIQNSELKCEDIGVSNKFRDMIVQGMVGACSPGGTAFPFFPWNDGKTEFPTVACKTGTAQHGGKETKPHAWITIAAPIVRAKGEGLRDEGKYELDLESSKRIVLTVMLEEAGEGSYQAAPVAKKILEQWFTRNNDH